MYIVSPTSSDQFARSQAGGKGHHLYRLSKAGLPVPEWRALGHAFFKQFLLEANLVKKITSILDETRYNLAKAEKQIEVL